MLNRVVPFIAILAVIIVAIMSFFLWRSAQQSPPSAQPPREVPLQRAEQARDYAKNAEQFAIRAETAAVRAEAAAQRAEALLLVEEQLAAGAAAAGGSEVSERTLGQAQEKAPATKEGSAPSLKLEAQP